MGIQGLIPFLDKASTPTNVSEFSGKTVAVDAYCWLHKGAFSCADKLARGDACDMYVHYCMKFVNMLLSHRIKPILVFDGQKLPAKSDTEKKRRENRELNRRKAAELMRMDRGKEAQTYLKRCVDITHEMALQLIRACRSRNVDCIVAPYEADAELAFLSINNIADVIITEDSDLLLFGAQKVLFKMDVQGNGLLIEREKLYLAMKIKEENFSFDKFRYMCILSGCDYLPSLPGIGLVKACRFITRTADPDIHRAISRMSAHLNMPQLIVTKEYRDSFMAADFMFKYQPVFDPFKRCIVPLNPFPDDEVCENKFKELLAINDLSEEQLRQLAYGNLDPFTLTQMDDWEPGQIPKVSHSRGWNSNTVAPHPSIWSENYVPNSWSKLKLNEEPPNALCANSKTSVKIKHDANCDVPQLISKNNKKDINEAMRQLKDLYHINEVEDNCHQTERKTANDNLTPESKKKNSRNPWSKSGAVTTPCSATEKRNVSALSKFAFLCKSPPSENIESRQVISKYFFSATTSPNEVRTASVTNDANGTEINSLKTLYSSHSPKSCESNNPSIVSERSPLKDQNIINSISIKTPTSPDLNKSVSSIRKRLNPFAVKDTDKKYRVTFPQENCDLLTADTVKKSDSTFKWSENMKSDSPYAISNKIASENDYKNPRKVENEKSDDNVRVEMDSQQEDEGFCSPSVEENQIKSPLLKKSKCRPQGLTKKTSLKQTSLTAMFAFKGPSKLKS